MHILTVHRWDLGDSHYPAKGKAGKDGPSTDTGALRCELKDWLEDVFGSPFEDIGMILPIAEQRDSHSCGPCVLNALENAVFATKLSKSREHLNLRIRYFVELSRYLLEDVGAIFRVSEGHGCADAFCSRLTVPGPSTQTVHHHHL